MRGRAISFQEVRNETPDRTYFITSRIRRIGDFFYSAWLTFSMDHIDLSSFKDALWPAATSIGAYFVNDAVSTQLSRSYTGTDDYKFVFQFLIGTTLFAVSAAHSVTEERHRSPTRVSTEIAMDSLAVFNLYTSTYQGSRLLLEGQLANSYSLIASLGVSTLVVPGIIARLAYQFQQLQTKRKYSRGAQRSDTALISCGLSDVGNIFFQANYFLTSEILSVSRIFQLCLISDNILNAQQIVQQFRNLPALFADAGPPIVKKLIAQREKLKKDYQFNNFEQTVVRDSKLVSVPRHKLRKGDLVLCDDKLDVSCVPVSGELFALKRDRQGFFTNQLERKKFTVNLKAHNGEDVAILLETNSDLTKDIVPISLHAISKKKQSAVLAGAKLDLLEEKDMAIRIGVAAERTLTNEYEKISIINQIIGEHKRRCVKHAMICALLFSIIVNRSDPSQIPLETLRFAFNLNQMQILFSETFLREMVNSRLMKDLNQELKHQPLQTIDALRAGDFANAIGHYYEDRRTKGSVIVSDKTGTLTSMQMIVRGYWTAEMKPDVQQQLAEHKGELLFDNRKYDAVAELAFFANTNSKKDDEPEEFSILEMFGKANKRSLVKVKNNHFVKTVAEKTAETIHLGLFKSLGGRFTLVSEGDNKYLIFCGIPRDGQQAFSGTPLHKTYSEMQMRQRVLSRDWCLARAPLSAEDFATLKKLFEQDDVAQLEKFFSTRRDILSNLVHCCTFLIDNPVKKGAENFIANCQAVDIPVFVATGDNANAAENIAKVLAPNNAKDIIKIRAGEKCELKSDDISSQSTVIFAHLNEEILEFFQKLLQRPAQHRPVIIFSEMSTEDKGRLALFLKNQGFFVVANGDGSNDMAMMKEAHFVIAHLTEEGTYNKGVEQFANLNDKQLQRLLHADKSFYELFDVHLPDSQFINIFKPLMNSQEKVSLSLVLKGIKMAWEFMNAMGIPVKQMPLQHWFSILCDFGWFGITYHTILETQHMPADNKHLSVSKLPFKLMLSTLALSIAEAVTLKYVCDEATNKEVMLGTLGALYFVLNSLYSSFGHVKEQRVGPEKSKPGFFSSCLRRKKTPSPPAPSAKNL